MNHESIHLVQQPTIPRICLVQSNECINAPCQREIVMVSQLINGSKLDFLQSSHSFRASAPKFESLFFKLNGQNSLEPSFIPIIGSISFLLIWPFTGIVPERRYPHKMPRVLRFILFMVFAWRLIQVLPFHMGHESSSWVVPKILWSLFIHLFFRGWKNFIWQLVLTIHFSNWYVISPSSQLDVVLSPVRISPHDRRCTM